MAYRKRRFFNGAPLHVYQRTINGFNIFYDREDFLFYLTVLSVCARKFNVVLLELCLMIDHLHMLLFAETTTVLSEFICYCTSIFVKAYNQDVRRKGALFKKAFGSAPKKTMKKIKSCIAYIQNNPVERLLCVNVEEYRWNFIAYAASPNPYSRPLKSGVVSKRLHSCIREVDRACECGQYLSCARLRRMFSGLSADEVESLTDYIITRYLPFDYDTITGYYGGYDNMLLAINSNAGSEYEINEAYYPHSDKEYREIIRYMRDVEGYEQVEGD